MTFFLRRRCRSRPAEASRLVVYGVVMGCGLALGPSVAAQELPHPRAMNLPAPTFEMPDTNRFRVVFQNDLMAWVVPDFSAPVVRYTAFVRAGYGDDNEGGVAEALTWIMRDRGPCWLGRRRLGDALDAIAADLSVTLGPEMTEITMTAPSEDAEAALRLFAGVLRQPCIDDEAVSTFAGMHAGEDDAAAPPYAGSLDEAVRFFRDIVFDEHRYRPGVLPSEAAALTIDDVEDYYRDRFTASNTTLAVSGAFRLDEMSRMLDFRFTDWEERRLPGFSRTGTPDLPDTVEVLIQPVAKLQTWIVLGQPLEPLEPRDLVALEVMNYVLGGGHFDTRLFRETRDKHGMTNDASGVIEPGLRGPGTYTFRTYGRPSVADSLFTIIVREIHRIQQENVTEEELFVAHGALADGVFPMQFENGHRLARTFAAEWATYLTFDHLARYQEWVRDTDAGDVRRAARRLRVDRLTVAVLQAN